MVRKRRRQVCRRARRSNLADLWLDGVSNVDEIGRDLSVLVTVDGRLGSGAKT